ncbi:hypothetical protein GCM10023206_04680 [Acinetobacter puyangensis]
MNMLSDLFILKTIKIESCVLNIPFLLGSVDTSSMFTKVDIAYNFINPNHLNTHFFWNID